MDLNEVIKAILEETNFSEDDGGTGRFLGRRR